MPRVAHCQVCSVSLPAVQRRDARYCGSTCRVRASRARRKGRLSPDDLRRRWAWSRTPTDTRSWELLWYRRLAHSPLRALAAKHRETPKRLVLVDLMQLRSAYDAVVRETGKSTEPKELVGRYSINRKRPFMNDEALPYPSIDYSFASNDEHGELFDLAEAEIHRIAREPIPIWAEHLAAEIREIDAIFSGSRLPEYAEINRFAELYIRLFDILPIYKDICKTADKFAKLVKARWMFSKLLYEAQPVPVRMVNYFARHIARRMSSWHP